MADAYLVRLDFDKMRENLFEDPPEQRTDAALAEWLRGHGMIDRGGGWWLCEDLQLDLFGDGEILEHRREV